MGVQCLLVKTRFSLLKVVLDACQRIEIKPPTLGAPDQRQGPGRGRVGNKQRPASIKIAAGLAAAMQGIVAIEFGAKAPYRRIVALTARQGGGGLAPQNALLATIYGNLERRLFHLDRKNVG